MFSSLFKLFGCMLYYFLLLHFFIDVNILIHFIILFVNFYLLFIFLLVCFVFIFLFCFLLLFKLSFCFILFLLFFNKLFFDVCKYILWFTEIDTSLRLNLSDHTYTGSNNFERIIGVLTSSSLKRMMDPISMGFLILHLRLLTTALVCKKIVTY